MLIYIIDLFAKSTCRSTFSPGSDSRNVQFDGLRERRFDLNQPDPRVNPSSDFTEVQELRTEAPQGSGGPDDEFAADGDVDVSIDSDEWENASRIRRVHC